MQQLKTTTKLSTSILILITLSVYEGTPLDLTRDSHTQRKQQHKNVATVFPFILKAKHKILHVTWAWAELENSTEKHSTRASINRV